MVKPHQSLLKTLIGLAITIIVVSLIIAFGFNSEALDIHNHDEYLVISLYPVLIPLITMVYLLITESKYRYKRKIPLVLLVISILLVMSVLWTVLKFVFS